MQAIKQKLNELKKLDKDFKIYGAKEHQYKLNPVLTEAEVAAFEQKHGGTLPDDYRWFLINIGNGGAGPYKGMSPLSVDYADMLDDDLIPPDDNYLFEDFPLTYNQKFFFGANIDYGNWKKDYLAWQIICKKIVKSAVLLRRNDDILIVKGLLKGTVWHYQDGGGSPEWEGFKPILNKNKDAVMTFKEWYEFWLDACLSIIKDNKEYYGYNNLESYTGCPFYSAGDTNRLEQYRISDEELEAYTKQNENILKHIDQLKSILQIDSLCPFRPPTKPSRNVGRNLFINSHQ